MSAPAASTPLIELRGVTRRYGTSSTELFAREVLPELHKLDARLHPQVCPPGVSQAVACEAG